MLVMEPTTSAYAMVKEGLENVSSKPISIKLEWKRHNSDSDK
jgi:hypothetical protein